MKKNLKEIRVVEAAAAAINNSIYDKNSSNVSKSSLCELTQYIMVLKRKTNVVRKIAFNTAKVKQKQTSVKIKWSV